jgi:hypothetical protein
MNSYPTTHRRMASGWQLTLVQLASIVFLCASSAAAQAVVEYAGSVAAVGGGAASLGKMSPAHLPTNSLTSSLATPEIRVEQTSSAHLPLREVEDVIGGNRRALEAKAGKDAAKVMLRSQPDGAWVLINGKGVGKTPLLLIVAPGVYRVEMHITQRESTQKQVDLLPKETREILLSLGARYPNRVEVSWQRH